MSKALGSLEFLESLEKDINRQLELCEAIKQALIKTEKEHNSVNLLMKELKCKDFAELRKYARCGYEELKKR